MESVNLIATIFTILGISVISIITRFIFIIREYKRFHFTKDTWRNCMRGYIEQPYKIEDVEQKCKLTKKLRQMVFRSSVYKMIFIIGKIGTGKTSLLNRFILKTGMYATIRGKRIKRIMGLQCPNMLEAIGNIEDKEDTILLIDGLEEAFIYSENDINILERTSDSLIPFYKVVITMNSDFYNENSSVLNDFYYRNADQKKIPALKIYLEAFTDKMIIKYVKKHIRVSKKEKKIIVDRAFQNKEFFSYPLMLSFILFFESYKGKYVSQLEILRHIFKTSLEWEEGKYTKNKKAELGKEKTSRIMNQISKKYLHGSCPIIGSKDKVHNVLLIYDKQTKKYQFQNTLFLYYNTVQKYYAKLCRNSKVAKYIYINSAFRGIYFEKIMQRHEYLMDSDIAWLQFDEQPYLRINNCLSLTHKWLLGLTKSLLNYTVELGTISLKSYRVNYICRKYFDRKYLDLHAIDIDESQLCWWFKLDIESLNISENGIKELIIPENWNSIQKLFAQNLPLKWWCKMGNLSFLKELDLSGLQINKISDLNSVRKLPDGINLDMSNCGMTNDTMPVFIYSTNFNEIYLDFNNLVYSDFIHRLHFNHLNVT